MSLQFILGPSGSGKTTKLYEQIIERASAYPDKTFMLVTPEQNNLSALKELLNKTPGRGILNIDVLGFNRLAHRIFDEAGGNNRQILDDTAKSLIIRRLASQNREKLLTLGGSIDKPGYIAELKSVISELMQYDIDTATLQNMMGQNTENTALYKKLSDISVLFESFKNYLKDRYITTEEILDRAYELSSNAKFLENCEIYLDGFTGFTPVQVRFLSRLMELCDRIVTTAIIGNDGDKELFGLGLKTIVVLSNEAKDNGIEIEPEVRLETAYRLQDNKALAFLEKNLYRFNGRSMELAKADCGITIHEYSNASQEAADVAKRIAMRVREGEIRYREIAVLTGSIEEYADELEKELAKYDIPLYIDKNINILLNPFSEMIGAAIQCVATGYQYEKVIRYLRSGLSDFEPGQIDEIDNYLRAAGIKRLYQYKNEWKYKPRYMGDDAEERLYELNEYREKIVDSLQMLENKKKKASEHARDLYDFILVNGVYQKIKAYEKMFIENQEASKIREYSQIYDSFMELLDKIVDFIGDEVISLSDFAKELEAGLAAFNLGMIPPGVDRVIFGDLTRSRFDGIREMYVLGCNEGAIPANNRKGGILSEDDREILCEQDFVLSPTSRELIAQDRFYIYMNLTKCRDALHISYPLMSYEGKALMPSSLINELKKIYRDLFICKYTGNLENTRVLTAREALDRLVVANGGSMDMQKKSSNAEERRILLLKKMLENDKETQLLLKRLYQNRGKLSATRKLPRDVAKELYGRKIKASITRLELFSSCPYSHFLKYGLSLEEVEEYGFASSDMGTIFHDTLQKYSELVRDSEYDWFIISEEKSNQLLDEALSFVSDKNRDSAIFENKRSEYMLNRIRRILRRTIEVMNIQIRKGSFEPYSYEMSFGYNNGIKASDFVLSEDEMLTLQGRIDRVDLCERDGKLFVKVIDYKSGSKNFSLANVYYGLSLQLVVYLGAAMEVHGRRNRDLEVNPAAILYYHVNDPLIDRPEGDNPEEIKDLIIKELCTKGLVNSDDNIVSLLDSEFSKTSTVIPVSYTKDGFSKNSSIASREEIDIIQNYVNKYIVEAGKNILDGEISANPYRLNKRTGCDYCQYRNICQKDELGNNYRELADMNRDDTIMKMRVSMRGSSDEI